MSMIKSFSYSLAAVLLSSTSAFALTCLNDYSGTSGCARNQTPAGDCSTLGYSKANVDGCVKYLYCPFDTSYKRCITQKAMDCSDYPLTKCPDNGFCSECNDGSTTKYKLDRCDNCFSQISVNGGMCSRNYQYDKCPTDAGAATCSECTYSGKTVYNILTCKPGYTLNSVVSNSRTCVANKCDGYTLIQCPANGNCSSCQAGSTIKWKLDSCKEGYYKSGNSCLPNTCSGFTLSTCPTNGICSECVSGSTTKYKLDSCEDGYKLFNNICKPYQPVIRLTYSPRSQKLTCSQTNDADNIVSISISVSGSGGRYIIQCNGQAYSSPIAQPTQIHQFYLSETDEPCDVNHNLKGGSNDISLNNNGGCQYIKANTINVNFVTIY